MRRLKVGDLVKVIAGKDKGKEGRVTRILRDDDRVVVEGLNKVVRHTKPNQRDREGGKREKEAPMHISNVMPLDASTGKPTRVTSKVADDGKRQRVARKTGAELKS
ncbi:MAG: 50S ribosomal protein L24 [Polyangiaceae bacterium]|nr:50S ribosomal protein L24 [Polyangiaceae bacterium]